MDIIDSAGIENGKEIIEEFLDNMEFELACKHLEYIISEYNIELQASQENKLKAITNKFK